MREDSRKIDSLSGWQSETVSLSEKRETRFFLLPFFKLFFPLTSLFQTEMNVSAYFAHVFAQQKDALTFCIQESACVRSRAPVPLKKDPHAHQNSPIDCVWGGAHARIWPPGYILLFSLCVQ